MQQQILGRLVCAHVQQPKHLLLAHLACSRVRSSAWRIQQATSIIHGENSRASAPALVYTSLLLILVFICALCALIDKAILLFLCRLALPVARAITAEHEVVAQEAGTVGAGSAV